MTIKKSHFRFTHQQRNGIFLLVFLIIALQFLYYQISRGKGQTSLGVIHDSTIQKQIDSLKVLAQLQSKPKIFPFNPNFLTDYKGYSLGMTPAEIDKVLAFRAEGNWINSARQFQTVSGISDSLLNEIQGYFKFPEFRRNYASKNPNYQLSFSKPRTYAHKIDLNKASAAQLQKINGIGKVLSERILKYRNSFPGGFINDIQLQDIYGLSPEVIVRIKNVFTVKTPRQVQLISLNAASAEDLVMVQHIDYELAHQIIKQRTLREGFRSWDELTKVKDFPQDKIEIIKLYLSLD